MRFSIEGLNLEIWNFVISQLPKLGHEFSITMSESHLTITVASKRKSTLTKIPINQQFFTEYEFNNTTDIVLMVKPFSNVFKANSNLIKSTIILNNDRLEVTNYCKFGIKKHHSFQYQSSTIDDIPPVIINNAMKIQTKIMLDMVANFPKASDASIIVDIDSFSISADTQSISNERALSSEVKISISDFDEFCVGEEGSISFEFGEFKNILLVADSFESPLQIQFDKPGSPIKFDIAINENLNLVIFLATHSNSTTKTIFNQKKPLKMLMPLQPKASASKKPKLNSFLTLHKKLQPTFASIPKPVQFSYKPFVELENCGSNSSKRSLFESFSTNNGFAKAEYSSDDEEVVMPTQN